MILDENQEVTEAPEAPEGEGSVETEEDIVTLKKGEYEKMNQTLGALKRELKDLRKSKEEPKETPQTDSALLEKFERVALKSAGITHPDDVELAKTMAKKWGMDIDQVVDDEDFKMKLERQQTTRANAEATSNIRGDKGRTQAKDTPDYWIAKGTPPTVDQVPNRKIRAQIARAMVANAKSSKTFYND